jgi:hypothetical protein
MIYWLLLVMLISHLAAASPAWAALRRGTLPPPAIAAMISFLLYYDFGIAFELLGFRYDVRFFRSILEVSDQTQRMVMFLLIVAPWVLLAGARLMGPRADATTASSDAPRRARLHEPRRGAFYLLAFATTVVPAWYGLAYVLESNEVWQLRSEVGAELGPSIVFLYLPIHILAFYAATEDSRTINGRLFVSFLTFGAICAAIICGQRTLVLFPVLLATLSFFRHVSLLKALGIAAACVVAAAAILPLLHGSYSSKSLHEDNLVVEIVHNDFSRAAVMATALELSPPLGTNVLPYPMSGYVYSAMFFVPRDLAPYKGRATATYFTSYLLNLRPEWLNWGFGVGMLEELILNTGTRCCLPGVFAYGLLIGLLARTELALPAVSMPLRIGPLFLCAYHLPSLLLNFGVMWWVCLVLSWLFTAPSREACALE